MTCHHKCCGLDSEACSAKKAYSAARRAKRDIKYYMICMVQELAGLRDFYEANLELAKPGSPISVFDADKTIVSRGQTLPPSIIHNCEIHHSLVGEGSILVVRSAMMLTGRDCQACVTTMSDAATQI